jgi:TRAP-type C4-dicarboxylate transport system substrate-binding protein
MRNSRRKSSIGKSTRRTILAAAAALATAALSPATHAQSAPAAPRILKYTDHEPLGGMRTRFLKDVLFAEIEKETNGRVRIEDHWDGEIADSHGVFEAVSNTGTADIGVIVPEYFAQQMPIGQLFKSFIVGPTGQRQVDLFRQAFREIPAFERELTDHGMQSIFLATGYPVAFYSTAPLANLPGIAGQKWRTASFWHRDFLRNATAQPVSIPWGQPVFDAMKAREIDGLMVNVDSGYMLDVHSVAPNVLASKDLWLGHLYIIAINTKTWNDLPEIDRAAIRRAAETAYARLGPVMDRSYDAMIADLRGAGATVRLLDKGEVAAFARATDYRTAQQRWATEQEAKGIAGVKDALARLTTLVDAAVGD